MKKILITGATGFVGSFLVERLVKDSEVIGTYLTESGISNIPASIKDRVRLQKIDLEDEEAVSKMTEDIRPDEIYHLAALASVGDSFNNPAKFINNNISAQVNVLESVRKAKISPKILIISSAEIYGNVSKEDLPIDEATPLKPVSPYGVSKLTQDFLGLQYYYSHKLPIIRVRPFNHVGPRQSPSFVIATFSKKIAEIEKGKIEPVLKVGNLTAKRDFTDVRDMVRAYSLLMEKGEVGEVYNAGSGRSYQISDILDKLTAMSSASIEVETDNSLLRPIDVDELICDNTRINQTTGWKAEIPIEKTLKDTLDYWRSIT